jgi:hypothetical protein
VQAETVANRQATFERIEAVRRDFCTRLEEAKEMAGHARGTGNGTCAVTPPKFNGTTSWSVFRHQFETVAEHNGWTPKGKSTYLITALEDRATDVLHGISKGATYEEILQALENCLKEELFASAYCSQLKVRTQKAGESLQDFATAIQQLARRTYPASPEEHIRREAGKAFVESIQDYEIKIRLLLGGEKTLSEALRQALEVHAVLIAARSQRSNNVASRWTRSPPSNGETQGVREAGTTRKVIIFGVDITIEGRRQMTGTSTMTKGLQGTPRSRQKHQRGDRVTPEKRERETANRRQTGEGRRRRANAGKCIKRPTSRVDRHFGKQGAMLQT